MSVNPTKTTPAPIAGVRSSRGGIGRGGRGRKGKGKSKNPEDTFMATLHKQLQETGQQVLQLQKAMRPQMPAKVFGACVKGTLVNLTQRISRNLCHHP